MPHAVLTDSLFDKELCVARNGRFAMIPPPQPHPFSDLPNPVTASIFQQLNLPALGECSLVCQAWRDLPYTYLPATLDISSGPMAAGILAAGLQRCSNVSKLQVRSTTDAVWPQLADAMCHQKMPALQELHIQHSSHMNVDQVRQLKTILQVQGPACTLHLAVTDHYLLEGLLSMLPMQGLASLELNVDSITMQLAELLLQAVAKQTASRAAPDASAVAVGCATPPQQLQKQQQALKVGLWVCSWGGRPGLALSDALRLHEALQAIPNCSVIACEGINISTVQDMRALQRLQGLQSLGLVFAPGEQQQPGALGALPLCTTNNSNDQALDDATRSSQVSGSCSGSGSPASALAAALAMLGRSLRQLTISGMPEDGGWGCPSTQQQQCWQQEQQGHTSRVLEATTSWRHPLLPLTGLTKLSVLGDRGPQSLPVTPIARLTLLQQLGLERERLSHPAELVGLSALRALRLLNLKVYITAEELLKEVAAGGWPVLEGPAVPGGASGGDCGSTAVGFDEGKDTTGRQQQLQQQSHGHEQHGQAEQPQQHSSGVDACQEPNCANAVDAQLLAVGVAQLQVQHAAADAADDHQAAAGVEQYTCQHNWCPCCSTGSSAGEAQSVPIAGVGSTAAPPASASEGCLAAGSTADVPQCMCWRAAYCTTGNPRLLDWSWLRQLHSLETAWLQVPHIDLSCLPSSLVELDAQQPNDVTRVSIICSGHGGYVHLPRLQRLVLPRPCDPRQQGVPAAVSAAAADACGPGAGFGSTAGASADIVRQHKGLWRGWLQEQQHLEAALLLTLVARCPEVREAELVQWQQLPESTILAAARNLRQLKLLTMSADALLMMVDHFKGVGGIDRYLWGG